MERAISIDPRAFYLINYCRKESRRQKKSMKIQTKITIIFMMMVAYATASKAQSTQIATLFHEGEVTNYSSATALAQALEDAVDGDVITLSGGMFQAADIKKNVSIRGAGMGYPALGGTTAPTYLTGNFRLSVPPSEQYHVSLEGMVNNEVMYITRADNLVVSKCIFNNINSSQTSTDSWINQQYIHCVINDLYTPNNLTVQFVNCVFPSKINLGSSDTNKSYQFNNCIVNCGYSVNRSNLTNCILIMHKGSAYRTEINSNSSCNNCIIAGCESNKGAGSGNHSAGESEIFLSEGFYNLTDAMKGFTGNDGSEIGIHGGSLPFSPVTTGLKITRFKVAERTTSDGKLPIEIEIEAF